MKVKCTPIKRMKVATLLAINVAISSVFVLGCKKTKENEINHVRVAETNGNERTGGIPIDPGGR